MKLKATPMCQAVASVWGYAEVEEPCPMHMFLIDWWKNRAFWTTVFAAEIRQLAYHRAPMSTLGINYEQESELCV